MSQLEQISAKIYHLPPLILHPFTESAATVRVLESARATLQMLRDGGSEDAALEEQVLEGRFTELRMVFYVGKDVRRWLDQCADYCARQPELAACRIPSQSFAKLLIEQTPPDVADKLRNWGVIEYSRIFSRSIGIYNQFREPPLIESLQSDYLRFYYRYADYAYAAWQDLRKAPELDGRRFLFTLYASGEYARMLEDEWNEAGA
jgi:hypothetical protein